jgi:hypothetical protein
MGYLCKIHLMLIIPHGKGKGKVKIHPVTCHEGTKGQQRYSPTLSLTSALDEGR